MAATPLALVTCAFVPPPSQRENTLDALEGHAIAVISHVDLLETPSIVVLAGDLHDGRVLVERTPYELARAGWWRLHVALQARLTSSDVQLRHVADGGTACRHLSSVRRPGTTEARACTMHPRFTRVPTFIGLLHEWICGNSAARLQCEPRWRWRTRRARLGTGRRSGSSRSGTRGRHARRTLPRTSGRRSFRRRDR